MESQTKLMTVDEWLVYDVPEGQRVELVDGVLERNPIPDPPHQRVVFWLTVQFGAYRAAHPEQPIWWATPGRLPVPGGSRGREPDLAVFPEAPALAAYQGPMAWKALHPVLVVEVVSPGQEIREHVDKRHDDHVAGIPEYWIIDPGRRLFLALRRADYGWNEHRVEASGTYSTPLLPGLSLDVGQLWS